MKRVILLLVLSFAVAETFGQATKRGQISRPVNVISPVAAGNPLDPNGDGWVTFPYKLVSGTVFNKTSSELEFSPLVIVNNKPTIDYTEEFEFDMFGLPFLKSTGGEPYLFDISCSSETDLIGDKNGFSVYGVVPNYNDYNIKKLLDDPSTPISGDTISEGRYFRKVYGKNLVFRFRLNKKQSASLGYHVLIDTDGLIGPSDPDYYDPGPSTTAVGNPGFELDILYDKNQITVYTVGSTSCLQTPLTYLADKYSQESVADLEGCGNPDTFLDFYIPLADLENRGLITSTSRLRFVATSFLSVGCFLNGNINDIGGVTNGTSYTSALAAFNELVNAQCTTNIEDICETCVGFGAGPKPPKLVNVDGDNLTSLKEGAKFFYVQVEKNPDYPLYLKVEIKNSSNTLLYTTTINCTASGIYTVTIPNTSPFENGLRPGDVIILTTLYSSDGLSACDTNASNTLTLQVNVLANNIPIAYNGPLLVTNEGQSLEIELDKEILPSTTPKTYVYYKDADNEDLLTYNDDVITFFLTDASGNPIIASNGIFVYTTSQGNTVTCTGGCKTVTYTPSPSYSNNISGPFDTFYFKATDGGATPSNKATISIKVVSINDKPVATAGSIQTNEDTAVNITLTGTDEETSTVNLTFSIVLGPKNGTLSGTAPNIIYTPNGDFNGSDSFTFTVTDRGFDSAAEQVNETSEPAIFVITVNPINDPPVITDVAVSTNEDTDLNITLSAVNPDQEEGNVLTYAVTAISPANAGILTQNSAGSPDLTFKPALNFNGTVTFNYYVSDDGASAPPPNDNLSETKTVTITVIPVNDNPVANDQTVTTPEDTAKSITLTASDVDGNTLTYTLVAGAGPTSGTLSGTAPNLTYTPNLNFNGLDSFTFKVNDGTVDSETATVSITVTEINDAPVADNQTVTTPEDTATSITLTGSDVDLDPLTFTVLTQPASGTLSGIAPNLTYTPVANFNGSVSFTFEV